jgi:hypothetical protein
MSDFIKAIFLGITIILVIQLLQSSHSQPTTNTSTDMDSPTPNDKTTPKNNVIDIIQESTNVSTISHPTLIEKSISINIPLNIKVCFQPSSHLALTLETATPTQRAFSLQKSWEKIMIPP